MLARASVLSARALIAGGVAIITEPGPSGSGRRRPHRLNKNYAIAVAKGEKVKGKGKKGKGKGQFGKNGVYGVDGFWGAEEGGGHSPAWAE